jgi:hypothetical protein
MASWRCPHCDAPQPETARCWVCHRSTTTCATCRQFRRSVATKFGYCALDKGRSPLVGDEERSCWQRRPAESGLFAAPADAAESPGAGAGAGADEGADAGADAGSGIWGATASAEASPDQPVPGHGMWTEADLARDPEPERHQHTGSIRERPWGPVPGHRDNSRGLRNTGRPRQD